MPCYEIEGQRPVLAPSCWVAPGAHVIGQVSLEAGASIWFGAVARGDNTPISIGQGTNIQDGAILHSDPGYPLIVGDQVTVGHRATLHGCTIGQGSLIGMGATVMNGAVIGEQSLVAANALVTEGKVFPPRSLIVGSPAKVVRQLDDATLEGLATSWKQYRDKAALFAQGLRVVEDAG
ncbi:Carbonic anhydrase or acetyltransferase, isoleucine patch superfamily [Pseudoxanthomonas sp. GM95]|uniref:gamma carbonic anhydrase family protein n=1 Tax=Pseudoxanthomonas sp. GM95 TaxID=1881043 RepID=UPI0008C26E00|nr:gamma carbonic anhydrase family protein [Pseudoxanthomonas sp. GM95]SEL17507.1 Carbonic anhydrase or acetyltransferase, isoleucine patch superfamily [Pseudoxanthomonas sp. GM95]